MNNNVFNGLGEFPETYSLELKCNATPVINNTRRISILIRENFKNGLNELTKVKVIEPVDSIEDPMNWIHNIVIIEKPNKKIRIYLHPPALNKTIKRHIIHFTRNHS